MYYQLTEASFFSAYFESSEYDSKQTPFDKTTSVSDGDEANIYEDLYDDYDDDDDDDIPGDIFFYCKTSYQSVVKMLLLSSLFEMYDEGTRNTRSTIISVHVNQVLCVNPLSANATKWSNTLKQLFDCV